MHYLFYGTNIFLINQKLDEWAKRFSDKNQALDIAYIDGNKLNKELFLVSILSKPFLSDKRLVIINNFLLENSDNDLKKYIATKLKDIPEETIAVFVEKGMPDARGSLFKALNKPKIAFKFEQLSPVDLAKWIDGKFSEESLKISSEAKQKLIAAAGDDLLRLSHEIEKLILYQKTLGSNTLLGKGVDLLVRGESSSTIFEYIESLSKKNLEKALNLLMDLLNKGEDSFYIFSMIIYQFRNLLIIDDLKSKGLANNEIAKESKLHPFVVSKSIESLRSYKKCQLIQAYNLIQETDAEIKAGKNDLNLALPIMTVKLCGVVSC